MSQAENMSKNTIEKAPQTARNLHRIRLEYAHGEALRYVSHLDMQMVWERTLRRAGVPLAYSQGFNPRPRLHMASALPLGFLSRRELTDFWMELPAGDPQPDLVSLIARVRASAPPGLEILTGQIVPLNLPALQTQVQAAEYEALPLDPFDSSDLKQAVERLLSASSLPRERRGKPYDLRPLIEQMEARSRADAPAYPVLFMRLTAREGATGRPEEVLDALGQDPAAWRVERTALLL